jgi:RHS repeat-associated protein
VTAFSYDAAGRRTGQSGPAGERRYSWDGLGRLTGIDDDGRARDVDIDALGRLVGFDGTTFTWDAAGPVAELVAVDDREVVGAAGHVLGTARPAGDVDWFGVDHRGSVATRSVVRRSDHPDQETTERGSTADAGDDRPSHDPWGAAVRPAAGGAAGGDPGPGFLGELDLGGLTWLRNRLYDPATRQFVAPDPLPGVPGTAVATNPYHYGNNDPVGMVDPLGLQPLSIDQYNDIRAQETGVQWGNIAMGALMVGSFFIPGGPIIATLVGAGMGMAPGIIQGVTTGNWDAGAIIKGGIVGGITGRLGFGMGGASSSLTGALARGGLTGAASGATGEAYDMLPLPGSDGQFDLENVALETVVGTATGGMGYRAGDPVVPTAAGPSAPAPASAAPSPYTVDLASPQRRTHILDGDATGGGHRWPGLPGKTPFPQSWSDDQIMHNVSDIATDPSLTPNYTKGAPGSHYTRAGDPSRYNVVGQRDGVDIKVVVEPAGEGIITAHPVT